MCINIVVSFQSNLKMINTRKYCKIVRIFAKKTSKNMNNIIKTGIFVNGINSINDAANVGTNVVVLDSINNALQDRIKNSDEVIYPNEIVESSKNTGIHEWAYSQLISYIKNGNIHSISLDESSKYLWVLDKNKNITDSNYTSHLHFVHILPGHISELINIMIQHNIDFNVFKF